MSLSECMGQISFIEHVVVQDSLLVEGENTQRGDIMMTLTSPQNTISTILPFLPSLFVSLSVYTVKAVELCEPYLACVDFCFSLT